MLLARLIPTRFWTRRCNGCADTSAHDSHLTWLGRLIFR
jgi:hypothetical protein